MFTFFVLPKPRLLTGQDLELHAGLSVFSFRVPILRPAREAGRMFRGSSERHTSVKGTVSTAFHFVSTCSGRIGASRFDDIVAREMRILKLFQ